MLLIFAIVLCSNSFTNTYTNTYSNTNSCCNDKYNKYDFYEIESIKTVDIDFIESFLSKINKGNNLISDICDSIEPTNSIFNNVEKPDCNIDIAFVDNNIIDIRFINEEIISFLETMKKHFCDLGEIECGEIIVGLKMIKLINQGVQITNKTNNLESIKFNINIIDFYDRFDNLAGILNNLEILTNITLKKHKANNYIEYQKYLMKQKNNLQWYESWSISFQNSLGNPIKNIILWTGSTLGEGIGSIFTGFSNNTVGNIYSIVVILIIVIILKKI